MYQSAHSGTIKARPWLLAACLAAAAASALAQSAGAAATAAGSSTAQAAAFRCGGVGQDEQERIKAEAARHGLLLSFSVTGGAYLADVDVEIRRGDQVVLQARCSGLLMLVDLAPAGPYEIRASAQGRDQRKTVNVGGQRPATVSFVWPAS
jgi:hypothetical protein